MTTASPSRNGSGRSRDAVSKQVWRSFATKTAAEVYLANTTAEIARGVFKAPDRVTFAEAAEMWYRHGLHVGGNRGP